MYFPQSWGDKGFKNVWKLLFLLCKNMKWLQLSLWPALWLASFSRIWFVFHSSRVCSHPPELLSPAAICLKNAYITSCENSFLQGLHEKAALHQMLLSFSAGSSRWQNICILHNLRDQSCVKVYAWIRMCLLMRTALTYSIISFFFYCTGHLKMSTNNNQFPQPSPPKKNPHNNCYYHLWFYYPYYVAARF